MDYAQQNTFFAFVRYFQNAMMKSHTTEYGSRIGVILHHDSTVSSNGGSS